MPKREIGLMGYIGECLVKFWLQDVKYNKPGFTIIPQIIPTGIPQKGGGYLDFGIIKDNKIVAVYEVKTQDYILDENFKINRGLTYIWENFSNVGVCRTQDGQIYKVSKDLQGFLILLVAPNKDGIKKIGNANIKNVILFSEIFKQVNAYNYLTPILKAINEDIPKVINIMQNPTQGKRINKEFLNLKY